MERGITMIQTSGRLRYFRRSRTQRNFGDELSPVIVDGIRRQFGLGRYRRTAPPFIALGSVLHMATDDTVVWGSGLNAKMNRPRDHAFTRLDVRAVRGPRTREYLLGRGIPCPEVYGDPGLLLPRLFDLPRAASGSRRELLVIPNLNDLELFGDPAPMLSPLSPWRHVLSRILESEFVVGSSLHAIILSEAYGVPARVVLPEGHAERDLKYHDYYEGSGRTDVALAGSIEEAIRMGPVPPPRWDPVPLLDAFPQDLFVPAGPLQRLADRFADRMAKVFPA